MKGTLNLCVPERLPVAARQGMTNTGNPAKLNVMNSVKPCSWKLD